MPESAPARSLILETSQRLAQVALAEGDQVIAARSLEEARRHARDLAPALHELLAERSWAARSLEAIFVSRGPGSYTGLRVGVMSAKVLAYATGCALLAVDTFAALARQSGAKLVDVIADAQQERVYAQRFWR
jgi:tRNA threonylcarbamoyladenosine biosynthesis protein TsaB